MRGKVFMMLYHISGSGITPAYAGKRLTATAYAGEAWDHPRLCGEKICRMRFRKRPKGSPPPMRGKVPFGLADALHNRITPAYAGKRQFVPPDAPIL